MPQNLWVHLHNKNMYCIINIKIDVEKAHLKLQNVKNKKFNSYIPASSPAKKVNFVPFSNEKKKSSSKTKTLNRHEDCLPLGSKRVISGIFQIKLLYLTVSYESIRRGKTISYTKQIPNHADCM